jgi:hypothetical protein
MWMECPGSFSYPANTADGGSSTFADNGTASHHWSAECLKYGFDAHELIGQTLEINGATYTMDEERAGYCQVYIDLVRQYAIGRHLWVEHKVDLSALGEGQGGTGDAVIVCSEFIDAIDLKYGTGEKVDASYEVAGKRRPNHQLALYAAGAFADAALLGYQPKKARLTICQPRINHIDTFEMDLKDLWDFAQAAKGAAELAGQALTMTPAEAEKRGLMHPGKKTCRWCKAQAQCPKLAASVAEEVRADFDDISAEGAPPVGNDTNMLSRAMKAVPLIEQWCKAVRAATWAAVNEGKQVIGSDGLPYKLIEGSLGKRQWVDEAQAEAALLGVLGPEKTYKPKEIITAPAAAKILDKKKTAAQWADVFEPLIERKQGRVEMVLGSEPGTPYTGSAHADDFEDVPE